MQSGGRSWEVPTGRKDGRVSIGSETRSLPGANDTVAVQKHKFEDKGLNTIDLVVLAGTFHFNFTSLIVFFFLKKKNMIFVVCEYVGGHTIGTTACQFFADRIYNPNGTTDPSIDPSFVPFLRQICPQNQPTKRVALDTHSQLKFDTSYFVHLKRGRGILRSDQVLWTDPSTRPFVQKYLATAPFNYQFGKSMVKMSNVGVKQGDEGEIRSKCSAIN